MLELSGLHAWHGKSHVLQGVELEVGRGEIVSLLGRNGAGRSTTLKAIIGEVEPHGSIVFRNKQIAGRKSFEIARLGLGHVPENRQVFPGLTVRQKLLLGMKPGAGRGFWNSAQICAMVPLGAARAETPGGVLSGGEQQLLSMCRTLMGDPEMILIDEPTEGLAPKLVEQVGNLLLEIAARGVAILLVEQKRNIAMRIPQRLYVMGHGQVVWQGSPDSPAPADAVRAARLEA